MGYPRKIVTCCYCGTRAPLVLKGQSHHELSCVTCGAPLHDLKMLPMQRRSERTSADRPGAAPADVVRPISHQPAPKKAKPKKSKKKRKSLLRYVVSEAFDILEDVLD